MQSFTLTGATGLEITFFQSPDASLLISSTVAERRSKSAGMAAKTDLPISSRFWKPDTTPCQIQH